MKSPNRIGIAVVEHAGRYLVGIRPPGVPLEGFAEFPGGKCHYGESPIDCAVRECGEETGLVVVADKLLHRREFEYPHGLVDLHFVHCRPANLADVHDQHRGFHWVAGTELKAMRFPEANFGVIELLTRIASNEIQIGEIEDVQFD